MTTTLHPSVERADLLIDLKRYEEARELLAQRLAEDPDDIRAWVELARSHLGDSPNAPEALEATERALALNAEDIGALLMYASALRVNGRFPETEGVLREAIRLAPDYWYTYARLADWLWRIRIISSARTNGNEVRREDHDAALREADLIAQEAIRLGPEQVYAYEVAWLIADMSADGVVAARMDEAILRLDPQHEQALARRTKSAATAPGVKAAEAATLYADALASTPDSAPMQRGLDAASYRLLRGLRWLALLCLALAATGIDLFATDGDTQRHLPLPLGQRLWDLVPMAAIWALGALLRYRRLRAGIRVNLHSLIRRLPWSRIVLGQAAWAMLCALLITQIPWTDRTIPLVLFWAGLAPALATMWFDRPKNA
ncbi:tetratricopeptide repeat protein [Streptomyces sp. 840.1]|uniref:tetratricopeptide repeat protein n=1 Tax=Streptomyces sp. 840.1 TaxID=2485152 RepID=UPI000FBBE306|nr:tetratricopeptide repeat protein [Streptomyces sp. 840.1]ROQ68714.1 tetratricopeptide repeat protein [Streptomyces sp. 840.1]